MNSVSIVIQGAVHPDQAEILKKFRVAFSQSQIIVSTWKSDVTLSDLADEYVISEDPGPFTLYRDGRALRSENINRQIVSTRAGLARANNDWTLKWRSDFDFDAQKLRSALNKHMSRGVDDALLVLGYNTANPFADMKLIGHLSDWMYFCRTDLMRALVRSHLIPAVEEHNEVPLSRDLNIGFPFASYSCEQLMIYEGLRSCYGIPMASYSDTNSLKPFLSLLGRKIFIEQPASLGVRTKKEYDAFIYPKVANIQAYVWFVLATINRYECAINHSFGCVILSGWLKTKAWVLLAMRRSKRLLHK